MRNHTIKAIAIIVIILSLAIITKIFFDIQSDPIRLLEENSKELRAYQSKNLALLSTKQETSRLKEVKQQQKIQIQTDNLTWWAAFWKVSGIIFVAIPALSLLIYATYISKAIHNRSRLVTQKIGEHHELTVDVALTRRPEMMTMIAGMIQADASKIEHPEQYIKFSERILSHVERATKAPAIIAPHPEQPALVSPQTPTFADLLASGQIARGKEMILAFENGQPRRGSFLDIYSAAVAGESGSGKTSTMLFLTGSGIISGGIRFLGIDPHYPHPKSLGFKTKPLWEAGLMQMATYKDDMLKMLNHVERTIDDRLKQIDTDETPVVLIIDELAFLSTTSIGKAIARTMERVSMEGRKCAVYMLASSQTWLTAKTGGSSSVRDTLTSAYVHRIKPKQANLLLQDKTEADKVRKQVKQAGDVLFIPIGDDSKVCQMPLATETDMHSIVRMVGNGQPIEISRNHAHVDTQDVSFSGEGESVETTEEREETQETPSLVDVEILRETIQNLLETKEETLSGLAKKIDVNKGQLYRFTKENQEPSTKLQTALSQYIAGSETTEEREEGVIDFARAKVNRDSQI